MHPSSREALRRLITEFARRREFEIGQRHVDVIVEVLLYGYKMGVCAESDDVGVLIAAAKRDGESGVYIYAGLLLMDRASES